MGLRLWDYLTRLLQACHLYTPGPYKYEERFKERRFTMWLIRAWCTVWIGMAAFGVGNTFCTRDIYNLFATTRVLREPPYSPPAYRSLLLATVWSLLAFSWNLLCCLIVIPIPWHLALGFFDVFISVALGVSQAEVYTFIPVSNETCFGGIERWDVPATGEPNLFVKAGNLTDQEPSQWCAAAVSAVTWQAAILGHEALVAVLTIMILLPKDHLFSINVLPWVPFRLATVVLREPFYVLHFFNASRRMRRARKQTAKDLELKALEKKVAYTGPFTTKLEEVLALEEAVLVIASRLHYYEIVRFAQANKRIRELIFPHRDLVIRRAKLQQATCCARANSDRRCWNCNIEVCVGNGKQFCGYTLGDGPIDGESIYRHRQMCKYEHHAEDCYPYCSWCYYTQISRNLFAAKRMPCNCTGYATGDLLCPNCIFSLEPGSMRDEAVINIVRQKTMDARKCYGCDSKLRRNRIWWICWTCKKQCTNPVHAVDRDRGPPLEDVNTV